MFKKGDKVKMLIGGSSFGRTVSEVENGAVYLAEGGDAFDNKTGLVYGGGKVSKRIELL